MTSNLLAKGITRVISDIITSVHRKRIRLLGQSGSHKQSLPLRPQRIVFFVGQPDVLKVGLNDLQRADN